MDLSLGWINGFFGYSSLLFFGKIQRETIMKTRIHLFLIIALLALVAGCGKKVARVDPNSVIDISGKWNDTDSRLVADEMINDALSRPWYQRFAQANKIPTVIIGQVRNRSHEHINVETFINDMQRSLINSGKVDFVADRSQRENLREEIASQAGNATDQTRKDAGQEIGADLMLVGEINSIVDQEGKEAVVFYQVNLELIEVESHRKLWIGDKKIKKYVTRGKVKP